MHIYEVKHYKSVICVVRSPGRFGMEELMYQKEIIYLGLYKDGERLGSAGFLKVERRDKDGNLSVVVKNVPHSINGKYPVRYYSGSDWKEADGITVREGSGQWEKKEADSLERIHLQIMLPGGYLVEGVGKEAAKQKQIQKSEGTVISTTDVKPAADPEKPDAREQNRDLQEQFVAVKPVEVRWEDPVVVEPVASLREESAAAEPAVPLREESAAERQGMPLQGAAACREQPQKIERIVVQRQESRESGVAPKQSQKPLMADALAIEGLKEDKWEQILDTYDNIHPYGDERIYVKLEPKDFIILSGKYQHLVNNSFLLHGFYNYRHVILGKEGEVHYLGVPGVFYEREKMVALMFGFEAFECGSRESKAGEFGYYLRKVEL